MENSILSKRDLLDEKIYTPESFLAGIIEDSQNLDIITESEAKDFLSSLYEEIYEYADDINDTVKKSNITINNHLYLVSEYLYKNLKPYEAIEKIISTPPAKLHNQAMLDFNSRLNNITKKLESNKHILGNRFYTRAYKSIELFMNTFKKYDILGIDFEEFSLPKEYMPMDYEYIKTNDILDGIEKYLDSFMLEYNMLEKFGRGVIIKIRSINQKSISLDRSKKLEIIEQKRKERIEEVKKQLSQEWKKNRIMVTKEYRQNVLEDAMIEFDKEAEKEFQKIDDVENLLMLDVDNMSKQIFYEYFTAVFMNLYPDSALPEDYFQRFGILSKSKEALFEYAFENNFIIQFSEEEQEYLRRFLF